MKERARVLILDDEVSAALPIRILLQDCGFEARETIFVRDFNEQFKSGTWDAVIVDVFLATEKRLEPIGLDLVRGIRQDFPDLPILLVSGWTSEREAFEDCAREIGGLMAWKPIKSEDLLGKLRSLMGEKTHG